MENSMSTDTKQTCMRQTCMAQQFHNGLMADYEGMMKGDLGKLWDGKLRVRAENGVAIAMFSDGSWYVTVEDQGDRYYLVAKDDEEMIVGADGIYLANRQVAEEITGLLEAWALEVTQKEAAALTNSMSRR